MTPPIVSRRQRLADLAGMTLVAGGTLCYARAFAGMQRLQHVKPAVGQLPRGTTLFAATAEYSAHAKLAYIGLAVAAIGIVVSVGSAVAWRRERRHGEQGATAEHPLPHEARADAPSAAA